MSGQTSQIGVENYAGRVCEVLDPALKEMQEELYHRAESAGEAYWAEAYDKRKADITERARFTLYVHRGEAGVQIYYKKLRFVRSKGRWRVFSAHVPIGGTRQKPKTKYTKGKFKAAPEWERKMIMELEEIYGPIRSVSRYLATVASTTRGAKGARKESAATPPPGQTDGEVDESWD